MGILNEKAKKELTKLEQEYKRQLNELMKGTPSAPFSHEKYKERGILYREYCQKVSQAIKRYSSKD